MKLVAQMKNNELINMSGAGTPPQVLQSAIGQYKKVTLLQQRTDINYIIDLIKSEKPVLALIRVGTISVPIAVMGKHTVVGGLLDKVNARPNVTANSPKLHWILVCGFDANLQKIYYVDTNGGLYEMSYNEFSNCWNWSLGSGVPKTTLDSFGVFPRTIIF